MCTRQLLHPFPLLCSPPSWERKVRLIKTTPCLICIQTHNMLESRRILYPVPSRKKTGNIRFCNVSEWQLGKFFFVKFFSKYRDCQNALTNQELELLGTQSYRVLNEHLGPAAWGRAMISYTRSWYHWANKQTNTHPTHHSSYPFHTKCKKPLNVKMPSYKLVYTVSDTPFKYFVNSVRTWKVSDKTCSK